MRTWLVFLLLLIAPLAVGAAGDYGREAKWAEEVVPGVVVGDPVYLEQANGHRFLGLYTEAKPAGMAVIVVHGIGIHPDWGMVGTLRQGLAGRGYTTLSIQMPVLAAGAKGQDYPPTFPEAAERLQLAADYLRDKGYRKVAIVSHSMGSRMSHAYMAKRPPAIAAWAALGITGGETYAGIGVPVLDLYGTEDLPQVLAGAENRRRSLAANPGSKQLAITGADHFFAGREEAMLAAVQAFLDGIQSLTSKENTP